MMRFLFAAASILLVGAVSSDAAGAGPASISGMWLTEGGKAVVEVGPCGGKMCGKIVKIIKPKPGSSPYDVKNPDPALRSRPVLGIVILTGFTPGGDRWRGRVYDPVHGGSYRSEMIRDGDTLKVRGCLGPFCVTQEWSRTS